MVINLYDCIIIGGGIIGCAAAYELSRYKLRVLLVEKENDVACGTTALRESLVELGTGLDSLKAGIGKLEEKLPCF